MNASSHVLYLVGGTAKRVFYGVVLVVVILLASVMFVIAGISSLYLMLLCQTAGHFMSKLSTTRKSGSDSVASSGRTATPFERSGGKQYVNGEKIWFHCLYYGLITWHLLQ